MRELLYQAVHADLVERSALYYLRYLSGVFQDPRQSPLHAVVKRLMMTTERALEKRLRLEVSDVLFSTDSLPPESQRLSLINEWSLGLGRESAPVIFIGTEAAFNPTRIPHFPIEACGLTSIWLRGGNPVIAAAIAGDAAWALRSRPYVLHPIDYYGPQPAGHTWVEVAGVVGVAVEDWGEHAYLIEASAFAQLTSDKGKPASGTRLVFLVDALATLRKTARVLVVHGRRADMRPTCLRLSEAFLNSSIPPATIKSVTCKYPKRTVTHEIEIYTRGQHRVIYTGALNGNFLGRLGRPGRIEYKQIVAAEIAAGVALSS